MFFVLMVGMELYYFAAFLTDYAQFSLKTVSIILYVTGILDIICALLSGVVLEKINLRLGGKYRSWFLIGPPIVAPLFVFQFTKLGSETMAVAVIIVSFISSHLLWNVVAASGGAIVGRMSKLPDEITILSTSRTQGMALAGLIFSLTGLPMITFFSGLTNKIAGMSITVAVYGLLMILGYLYIFKITAGKDPYDEKIRQTARKESGLPVKEMVRLVFHNRPLLMLIIAEIFRNACIVLVAALAFYYFEYVLKNLPFLSVFLMVTAITGFLGSLAAAWIGLRLGKRHTYWISLALSGISYALARFLGTTAWSFTILCGFSSAFTVISSCMCTALFSDTVVYGEWKTGKNIRALTMGLLNLPIKIGVLLRSAVVTLGLMSIGFVSSTTPSERVVSGIASLMTLSPAAVCALAAIIFFFGYKMEDAQVVQMQSAIAAQAAANSHESK